MGENSLLVFDVGRNREVYFFPDRYECWGSINEYVGPSVDADGILVVDDYVHLPLGFPQKLYRHVNKCWVMLAADRRVDRARDP